MVVDRTQPRNFVPKIWNKIVAKISVRSIPSDAEIFDRFVDQTFGSKWLVQKFFVKKKKISANAETIL